MSCLVCVTVWVAVQRCARCGDPQGVDMSWRRRQTRPPPALRGQAARSFEARASRRQAADRRAYHRGVWNQALPTLPAGWVGGRTCVSAIAPPIFPPASPLAPALGPRLDRLLALPSGTDRVGWLGRLVRAWWIDRVVWLPLCLVVVSFHLSSCHSRFAQAFGCARPFQLARPYSPQSEALPSSGSVTRSHPAITPRPQSCNLKNLRHHLRERGLLQSCKKAELLARLQAVPDTTVRLHSRPGNTTTAEP